MLKKLIKHEWKSTSKMGGIVLLVIAGMSLIGTLGITLLVNYFLKSAARESEGGWSAFILFIMIFMFVMLYMLTFMGVTYGMMIYLGMRFYRTMYSREGYLTHTLPVTPKQLLFSKTLVAGLWYLLVTLGIILSIGILLFALDFSLKDVIMREKLTLAQRGIDPMLRPGIDDMAIFITAIAIGIPAVIVTPFTTMMILFGSLTVGQLSQKYKALMGILVYIGVVFVNSICVNVINAMFINIIMIQDTPLGIFLASFCSYGIALLLLAGIAVGFYFISRHILEKRLNLE